MSDLAAQLFNLLVLLFSLFTLLVPFILLIRFEAFIRWEKTVLEILKGGRGSAVWFIFLAALLSFIRLGLFVHTLSIPPTIHRVLLVLICIYTFVFFNPQAAVSRAKANEPIYCPDGYAYQLPEGAYIRCEDFDLYHEELGKDKIRTDLHLQRGSL